MREYSYELYLGPEYERDAEPREERRESSPSPTPSDARDPFTGKLLPGCKVRAWSERMDANAQERAKRGWANLEKSHQKGVAPEAAIASTKQPVWMLDMDGNTVFWFESSNEAFRKTGINAESIRRACRGLSHTAGGFKWEFDTRPRTIKPTPTRYEKRQAQKPKPTLNQATHPLTLNGDIDPEAYYKQEDVHQFLGISVESVYRYAMKGLLPYSTEPGNRRRWHLGRDILRLRQRLYGIAADEPITPTTKVRYMYGAGRKPGPKRRKPKYPDII